MDNRILQLLESSNPEDRKRAIKAMAKSETSEEALRKLVAIYKTDSDEDVRQLALAAGKRIRKKQKEQEWEGSGAKRGPVEKEAVAQTVQVSEGNVKKAKMQLDRAMNSLVEADYEKAREFAVKAYELNPNILNDDYSMGLVSSVFEVPSDEVLPTLHAYIDGDLDGLPDVGGEGKAKRKRGNAAADVSAGRAIFDIVIYGAVNALFVFIMFLAGTTLVTTVLANVPESAFNTSPDASELSIAQIISFTQSLGLVTGLMASLITFICAILGHVLFVTILHFIAKMMLNGAGTWAGLVHKVTFPILAYNIVTWLLTLAYYAFIIVTAGSALSDPSAITTEAEMMAQLETLNNLGAINILFSLLSLAMSIGYLFFLAHLIGKAHDFGMGSGCATIFISFIVTALFSCGCVFAFTSILGAGFSGMSGSF